MLVEQLEQNSQEVRKLRQLTGWESVEFWESEFCEFTFCEFCELEVQNLLDLPQGRQLLILTNKLSISEKF